MKVRIRELYEYFYYIDRKNDFNKFTKEKVIYRGYLIDRDYKLKKDKYFSVAYKFWFSKFMWQLFIFAYVRKMNNELDVPIEAFSGYTKGVSFTYGSNFIDDQFYEEVKEKYENDKYNDDSFNISKGIKILIFGIGKWCNTLYTSTTKVGEYLEDWVGTDMIASELWGVGLAKYIDKIDNNTNFAIIPDEKPFRQEDFEKLYPFEDIKQRYNCLIWSTRYGPQC
ncbi:hypothetical protein [Spiroplasma endosymbiont of Aspidapion aeneum]|uniref:hypothetical protein n=1 Tax=Spiroplasma endosymbiont of Aspidapion aeneum TaxID=3066276 RepID=UPI00313EA471